MNSTEISDTFLSTRETIQSAGIDDDFFLDLISARLLVERVGESKNHDWWESRVLSETGRTRLEEVTPKTRLQSRVNLATKVGNKAESDRLPDDAISLFSFGPRIEARVGSAIEELETNDSVSLTALEDLTVDSLKEGWTDEVIAETGANISSSSDAVSGVESTGESTLLADEGYTQDEIEGEKWRLLTTLLTGYGHSTESLTVPYYPLESEIQASNA
jgi:hypothetical protein